MVDAVGGLLALLIFGAVLLMAGLLISSHGVLIKEAPTVSGWGFNCTYFTGTRSVDLPTMSSTGCARFIKVGG